MIKVWVGSLAAYNAGALVGEWVKLPKEDEELQEVFSNIRKEAEALDGVDNSEEMDIFDIDSSFEGLDAYGLNTLNELAKELDEFCEQELEDLEAVIESLGNLEDAIEAVRNGEYIAIHGITNHEDLGLHFVEEMGGMEVPEHLANYIDYEAIGRDMTFSGWTITSEDIAVCID